MSAAGSRFILGTRLMCDRFSWWHHYIYNGALSSTVHGLSSSGECKRVSPRNLASTAGENGSWVSADSFANFSLQLVEHQAGSRRKPFHCRGGLADLLPPCPSGVVQHDSNCYFNQPSFRQRRPALNSSFSFLSFQGIYVFLHRMGFFSFTLLI